MFKLRYLTRASRSIEYLGVVVQVLVRPLLLGSGMDAGVLCSKTKTKKNDKIHDKRNNRYIVILVC